MDKKLALLEALRQKQAIMNKFNNSDTRSRIQQPENFDATNFADQAIGAEVTPKSLIQENDLSMEDYPEVANELGKIRLQRLKQLMGQNR